MLFQFSRPTSRKKNDNWIIVQSICPIQEIRQCGSFSSGKTVNHRVSDKFHAQLRHALRIPSLLERENAQEQIIIARQLVGAARTRCPDLRRDELDDFRIPRGKRIFADISFDRLAEAQVEPDRKSTRLNSS